MENEAVVRRIGQNLRNARGAMKQADVVRRLDSLGVPLRLNLISRMENGVRVADAAELLALAIALGVTPNRLLLSGTASTEDEIELTPNVRSVERTAWVWAVGDDPLYPGDLPEGIPSQDLWDFRALNRPHHPPNRTMFEEVRRYTEALEKLRSVADELHLHGGIPRRVIGAYLGHLGVVFDQASADDDGR